jgi:hypothetical protein
LTGKLFAVPVVATHNASASAWPKFDRPVLKLKTGVSVATANFLLVAGDKFQKPVRPTKIRHFHRAARGDNPRPHSVKLVPGAASTELEKFGNDFFRSHVNFVSHLKPFSLKSAISIARIFVLVKLYFQLLRRQRQTYTLHRRS